MDGAWDGTPSVATMPASPTSRPCDSSDSTTRLATLAGRKCCFPLPAGRPLDVAAELEAHRREYLVGEVFLAARREPLVESGTEHRGRSPLIDGGRDRPTPLT